MTCSQAIRKLLNLSQGELKVHVYKERFHLLAECSSLDAKGCVGLFFYGLLPTLKLAIDICSHGDSLEEIFSELKRNEAHLPVIETASDSFMEACVAIAGQKPYDLWSYIKPYYIYLLLFLFFNYIIIL